MAQPYNYELVVEAPKEAVLSLVSDPFTIAGVMGHVAILLAYDEKAKEWVPPGSLSSPSDKFRVAYIYLEHEKVSAALGEMKGPIASVDSISYKGFSYDNTLKWELDIYVKTLRASETQVRISYLVENQRPFLARLIGRPHPSAPDHIVKDHIIPYLKLYFKYNKVEVPGVVPAPVFSEEGQFGIVLAKLMKVLKDVKYGLATIEGNEIRGKLLVKMGKVERVDVLHKGQLISTPEDLLLLLGVESPAKISLYTVDVDSVVTTILERAIDGKQNLIPSRS